jgi:hypothetical protein
MVSVLEVLISSDLECHVVFPGMPLNPVEQEAFQSYLYHIAAARGSGEYALRHILVRSAPSSNQCVECADSCTDAAALQH